MSPQASHLYTAKCDVIFKSVPESWCQKDTDVSDVHRNVECVQHIVYAARCEHQAWIHGAPHNAAQWVPCSFIEPVQEIVNTILHHVCCGPIVKPAQDH